MFIFCLFWPKHFPVCLKERISHDLEEALKTCWHQGEIFLLASSEGLKEKEGRSTFHPMPLCRKAVCHCNFRSSQGGRRCCCDTETKGTQWFWTRVERESRRQRLAPSHAAQPPPALLLCFTPGFCMRLHLKTLRYQTLQLLKESHRDNFQCV